MQIGTLVRWTGDNDEDYGALGIVTKICGSIFWVSWSDGEVVDYLRGCSHAKKVEVLCE